MEESGDEPSYRIKTELTRLHARPDIKQPGLSNLCMYEFAVCTCLLPCHTYAGWGISIYILQ